MWLFALFWLWVCLCLWVSLVSEIQSAYIKRFSTRLYVEYFFFINPDSKAILKSHDFIVWRWKVERFGKNVDISKGGTIQLCLVA